MKISYKRWAALLLAALTAGLLCCAAVVYTVDPFFHYHAPDPEGEVWFDQRYQSAGLLRSQEYETVLMGSSLAANYRAFWFDVFYDTSTVKVTFPNGGFAEFDTALQYAFEKQALERVILGLDPNLLARSPEEAPDQLPEYLYDDKAWNDGKYLFNKDVLMRSAYALLKRRAGETQTLQDAFVWDGNVYFSRDIALAAYQRPETVAEMLPADHFLANCEENLAVVTRWLEQHPDTTFTFFFSPYSILSWDRYQRNGELEAMLTMLDYATETLLRYDNAELQFFMADYPSITDLDNYADHLHVAGRVTYEMARTMPEGKWLLTAENRAEVLDGLREFVVNYNYECIFNP